MYQGRRLMEVFGTATDGASGTVDLAELAFYPTETDYFDTFGLSCVGGTGSGTHGRITLFTQASNRLTFTPVQTYDVTSLIEVWQSGLDAQSVDDCINQALDIIQDQVLQFESNQLYAFEYGRQEYPLPSGLKFVHSVQVYKEAPTVWVQAMRTNTFRSLDIAAGSAQLAMGFQPISTQTMQGTNLYRGLVVWLRKQGTISTARTLTLNVEGNYSGSPDNSEVSGATATFSTDNIYPEPAPCFFDFGRPIYLVPGTQYHMTLDISGTLDASNFIQWAEDTTNGYGGGALSTGTSGNAWTQVAGSDMIFALIPWGTDFLELPGNEWELVPGPSRTYLRYLGVEGRPGYSGMGATVPVSEGCPLRVLAYSRAGRPSADTDELEVPRSYLEAKALSLALARIGAPQETLAFWTALADDEWKRHGVPTGLMPNSREVTPT